jgi:hypothetical protein
MNCFNIIRRHFPVHLAKLISSLIILAFKHQNLQGSLDALSNSSSHGRSYSCSSSVTANAAIVEGQGGGGGLHKTNTDDQQCIKKRAQPPPRMVEALPIRCGHLVETH